MSGSCTPDTDLPSAEVITENWCSSRMKMIKCNCTWTIDNFSCYEVSKNKVVKSSLFSAGMDEELKWRLHLYPNGNNEESNTYLSVFLSLEGFNKPEIKAKFECSILDTKRNKYNRVESVHRSFKQHENNSCWGCSKFIAVAALKKHRDTLLPDDKLTIFCEVDAYVETVNVSGHYKMIQHVDVPTCSLADDLSTALDNKKASDVMFTVSNEKFYAHKVILAARSPIFSAIFDEATNDEKLQIINVEDVNNEAFREMLRYIYTGKAPRLHELAAALLVAADRYALKRLKAMCEEHLCKNLAVETAANVMIVADQHEAEQLKIQTRDFILSHFEEIKATTGFNTMVQYHPDLLVETLSVLAMRINEPKLNETK